MSCPHEMHLELVQACAHRMPLMILWRWGPDDEGDIGTCQAEDVSGLRDDVGSCDAPAIWHVAIPTHLGAGEVYLCAHHLPLLLLRGTDDDLTEPIL